MHKINCRNLAAKITNSRDDPFREPIITEAREREGITIPNHPKIRARGFWCPVPIQVRTYTQTYVETRREGGDSSQNAWHLWKGGGTDLPRQFGAIVRQEFLNKKLEGPGRNRGAPAGDVHPVDSCHAKCP
jgi:hypothetical protein